jgi:hypothetical protein
LLLATNLSNAELGYTFLLDNEERIAQPYYKLSAAPGPPNFIGHIPTGKSDQAR